MTFDEWWAKFIKTEKYYLTQSVAVSEKWFAKQAWKAAKKDAAKNIEHSFEQLLGQM